MTLGVTSEVKASTSAAFDPLPFLLDVLHDAAFCTLDAQGHVTEWNDGCERLLGYGRFEALGRHLSTFYSEEDRRAQLPQQVLSDAARQGRLQSESRWLREDGNPIFCRLLIEPIRSDDALAGYAALIRDISARKATEIELAAAREKLDDHHRLELLGQMAGGAAHDFSTMMAVIKDGLSQLRADTRSPEERENSLHSLEETVDHATALAAQLMTYAHQQPPRREEFDVVECLLDLRTLLESMLGDKVTLKMHLSPDRLQVDADRHLFETAIFNFVVNARDAIVAGGGTGRITLGASAVTTVPPIRRHPGMTGPFAAISVTDTGPGIPADICDRIFEPFFSTKNGSNAAGLGLAQAMSFARQSGGNIDAAGSEGQGATFTLYLPRTGHRSVTALSIDTEAPAPAGGDELSGTVLMVEDNARVAETTMMMLEDIGLTPTWARDAEDALAKLHKEAGGFDLVLTDVVMPRMSGIALARIIATRWPSLPVVLVSGYSDDLTTGYGGDLDLIQKPFTRKGLLGALKRYLEPEGSAD